MAGKPQPKSTLALLIERCVDSRYWPEILVEAMPISREWAMERFKLEREMDADLAVILDHIEHAYCTDDDDDGYFHPTLAKEDREKLFQACLSLSRRLKALEGE